MATETDIRKLQHRIDYLEDNRRYIQNALESVLSLGEFQTTLEKKPKNVKHLLEQASKKICSIIPFAACTFYLVDEESFLFEPTYCNRPQNQAGIKKEVDNMIDEGMFAWAIREKRGVFIPSKEHQDQYLLHVITADGRIDGMFLGVLPKRKQSLADTSLTLLSIVLLRVANALEDLKFCRYLENQKEILEKQVTERTKELTRSQVRLKQSMKKANTLAFEAKKASEAKSDFLAKMSHELRTPLNGIIGMVEVALSTKLDENQQQILEIVDRESCALLSIINDILDFSKVEAGKLQIEQIHFDLRKIVDEVGDTLCLQASKKRLRLNTYIEPAIPINLMGDPLRLKQVLLNLAGNALKFTQQGEINIMCTLITDSPEATKIKLGVQDTGIGIPKEKQATIFEGFSQADESTTRKYGGTGLGITISKQLVELMGGDLILESSDTNGSIFSFELPFQKTSPIVDAIENTVDEPLNSAFVIDNCPTSRQILANYLKALHYQVHTVGNTTQPVAILENTISQIPPIDVIFIDLETEGTDLCPSVDTIYKLKKLQNTPIVAVCGPDEQLEADGNDRSKYDKYLSRPLKYEALKTLLLSLRQSETDTATDRQQVNRSPKNDAASLISPQCTNFKILLVDDYPTNQRVASLHLHSAGYTVDVAVDGSKAIEAFQNDQYDLILMDIQMPVMDGFTAAKKIRSIEQASKKPPQTKQRRTNSIPIIAMTAHAYKEDQQKCIAAGMNDFISKPIRKKALLAVVQNWIRDTHHKNMVKTVQEAVAEKVTAEQNAPMDFPTAVSEFGSREVVMEVAQQLVQNIADQIKTMSDALVDRNFNKLQGQAHSIKGGAGTIEAHPLAALAKKIETLCRTGDDIAIEQTLTEFRAEFDRLNEYVTGGL